MLNRKIISVILLIFALFIQTYMQTQNDSERMIKESEPRHKQISYNPDKLKIQEKVGKGKVVALDNYYNHEFKKDKDGEEVLFHYLWEDLELSGYSELGNMIENLGAEICKTNISPKHESLRQVSIYIIVDPDTPKETFSPNYITDSSIVAIEKFVKSGGVLVLLGNDFGNCEFEHLNKLSAKFGIHFNEVSIHKVIGNNYSMAKYDKFPNHPIFKNVKSIYLKEISTLTLNNPAKPILIDGDDVIMASSKIGKGLVFALGDPWFYNEYFDNRVLPKEFQNYKAAKNLFVWLLSKAKKVK